MYYLIAESTLRNNLLLFELKNKNKNKNIFEGMHV